MHDATVAEHELAAALAHLAALLVPVAQTQRLPLAQARGRVLAADIVAAAPLPAEDLAAMDGYAVRSAEAGAPRNALLLAGRVLAGERYAGVPPAGSCVRIMTGAPMPQGCDAVVMQEQAALDDAGRVVIPGPVAPGHNCRRRGEHVGAGSVVLRAGRRLRSADLALAGAAGAAQIDVFRTLRIGVLSTGDELRDPPAPLAGGLSYDSNRPMILAALGGGAALACIDLGICPDRPAALARALEQARAERCDAVLVTGGASQGDADIVRTLPGMAFLPLRLRPGRGLAWSLWPGAAPDAPPMLLLGLPGNAVAAFVLLHLLVRPLLARLGGAAACLPRSIALPLLAEVRNRAGRIDMRRARLVSGTDGELALDVLPEQGSAMIRTVSEADALVAVGPAETYRAGSRLPCYLLDLLDAA